jgi:hypothetical protein
MEKDVQSKISRAKDDLLLAVADQLDSGKIDRTALQPKVDRLANVLQKASPVTRAALDQLHRILTPEQRGQFADALSQAIDERRDSERSGAWIERWASELGLSGSQKCDLTRAVEASEKPATTTDEQRPIDRLLEQFKGDSFSADRALAGADPAQRARTLADRIVGTAQKVGSVLTDAQRVRAAELLRDHVATQQAQATECQTPSEQPSAPAQQPQGPSMGGGGQFPSAQPGFPPPPQFAVPCAQPVFAAPQPAMPPPGVGAPGAAGPQAPQPSAPPPASAEPSSCGAQPAGGEGVGTSRQHLWVGPGYGLGGVGYGIGGVGYGIGYGFSRGYSVGYSTGFPWGGGWGMVF